MLELLFLIFFPVGSLMYFFEDGMLLYLLFWPHLQKLLAHSLKIMQICFNVICIPSMNSMYISNCFYIKATLFIGYQ